MIEVAGNMHIHTPYSDGTKWHAEIATDAITAGLDFIIVTDHNVWVDGVEGYYRNAEGQVLLLTGEEVHNVRRRPQASHFLAYGAEKELSRHAADPQDLIDETLLAGGFGFLAHPHERVLDIIESEDLGWHDWDIEGFTGLEIWNYMSSVKNALAARLDEIPLKGRIAEAILSLRAAYSPQKVVIGPEVETLRLWDQLLATGQRVAGIGNSDAHAIPMNLGPIKQSIYPYEYLFRTVNTHLLIDHELTGELVEDKRLILSAIGRGRSWIGYDLSHPTKGFQFTVQGKRRDTMGVEMTLGTGATLQINTPARCHIRLIRHGDVVAEVESATNLSHSPTEPGAFRVECLLHFEGRERGWIYSNPIYLR